MKRLTLMRHGKAESEALYDSDFERPLAARGVQEAALMAERLAQSGWRPQRILTSPAPRALTTAGLAREALGGERVPLQTAPELYLATPDELWAALTRHAGACDDVLLVGHNPGLSELGRRLAPVRLDDLPTAGVIGFEFDGGWDDWQRHAGRLVYFDHPLRALQR